MEAWGLDTVSIETEKGDWDYGAEHGDHRWLRQHRIFLGKRDGRLSTAELWLLIRRQTAIQGLDPGTARQGVPNGGARQKARHSGDI